MHILLVDDLPANLLSLKALLKDLVAEEAIITANSGEAALKHLLSSEVLPVLVILDVQMPLMNGYEVARNMRAHPRTRHIPIIFLSAIYSEQQYILNGYECGAVDFLIKPFNPTILLSKVQVFLNMERYRREIEWQHIQHAQLIEKNAQEREAMQQKLFESKKMQSLGQMASGIAHDFNNILSCMLGFAELAAIHLENTPNPDIAHCLEQVTVSGGRATHLIHQIMDYVRHDSIADGASVELVQVADLMHEVLTMLQGSLPSTIQLQTQFDTALPKVLINPTKLHQLITNLIVNARDAMDGQPGTLAISLGLTDIDDEICSDCHSLITEQYLEISVADSGMGIAPDKMENIFEPFFTTKEVGKGTGLGLSVVSGVVHKAKGHILVSSEVGAGTHFRILLPCQYGDVSVSPKPVTQGLDAVAPNPAAWINA